MTKEAHLITGSKTEIADSVVRMSGVIREAIVFVEEPSDLLAATPKEDIFAEMEPFAVRVGNADDSRESLYSRMEGE